MQRRACALLEVDLKTVRRIPVPGEEAVRARLRLSPLSIGALGIVGSASYFSARAWQ